MNQRVIFGKRGHLDFRSRNAGSYFLGPVLSEAPSFNYSYVYAFTVVLHVSPAELSVVTARWQ